MRYAMLSDEMYNKIPPELQQQFTDSFKRLVTECSMLDDENVPPRIITWAMLCLSMDLVFQTHSCDEARTLINNLISYKLEELTDGKNFTSH